MACVSLLRLLCLVAPLLVALVRGDNRIVFDASHALVSTRLDPVIYPGVVSQHMHRIVGASNFEATYNPTKLRQSSCTNLQPQADKSNYWHPMIYKVNWTPSTGTYTYSPMHGRTRIYYNFPQTKNNASILPFPDDFRMISGNPAKKTGGGYTQEDFSIFYYYETEKGSFESYSLPKEGVSLLVSKVWFGSCWNGQPFDPAAPGSHVKFPLVGGGLLGPNCPAGYEKRIPSILVETYHFGANDFPPGPGGPRGGNGPSVPTYILANGDTTGYGLHADFQNGWDTKVLAQMVTECRDVDPTLSPPVACPALAPSWDQAAAEDCHLSSGTLIPPEDIGWTSPLNNLPGCNLPWGASGSKPSCPGYSNPPLTRWSTYVGPEDNEQCSPADIAKYASLSVLPSRMPSTSLSTGSTSSTTTRTTATSTTTTKRPTNSTGTSLAPTSSTRTTPTSTVPSATTSTRSSSTAFSNPPRATSFKNPPRVTSGKGAAAKRASEQTPQPRNRMRGTGPLFGGLGA